MCESDSEDDIGVIFDEVKVALACKNPLAFAKENEQLKTLDLMKYFIQRKVKSEANKSELVAIINYCGNYDPDYVAQEVSNRFSALNGKSLSKENY